MYLAIGPHGWASDTRPDWALQKCIDYIAYWDGLDAVPFTIYSCHKSTYVDEMGNLRWKQGKDKPVEYMKYAIPPKQIHALKDAQSGLEYDDDNEFATFCDD